MSSSRRPRPALRVPPGSRRPPFDVPSERATRTDLVTAAVIAAVVVLTAALVVLTGTAARARFDSADAQPSYGPAVLQPAALAEVYRVPSEGTGAPLVTRGNLVTVAADGRLTGYEAGVATEKWHYDHPGSLCGVAFYSENLVSVWTGAAGCSDVTALNPTDQVYSGTRQSAFADSLTMWHTWGHALIQSPERVEIWRSDLVRTVEYGQVQAPQESAMQPRTGCTIGSAGLDDERFAVSERCPGDSSERLTISKTVPEDSRKPEEIASGPTGADGLWIMDVTADHVLALQKLGNTWSVERYTSPEQHRTVLKLPGEPAMKPSPDTVAVDDHVRWFDGSDTHSFTVDQGTHAWTARGTLGPGMAVGYGTGADDNGPYQWTMLPTAEGFSVLASADGAEQRRMRLETPRSAELIGLSQVGDILYERRPGEIVAYKMTPG